MLTILCPITLVITCPHHNPMQIFRKRKGYGQQYPQKPNRRRNVRATFTLFCSALLCESIALQVIAQVTQPQPQGEVAAAETSRPQAMGAMITPIPSSPTHPAILANMVKQAQAASTSQPQTTAVVFHSPLRTYVLTQYFHTGHPAIDMAAPTGTPIYASTVGTVAATGYVLQGGGLMVKITHPNGFISYYAHMSKITAQVGEQVDNNTQIGLVGQTGWATGPHVHFMLTNSAGVALNPLAYLK